MKLVVTGASGFIGRAVVRRLASDGYEVTGLIGRSAPEAGCGARQIRVDFAEEELPSEARHALADADAVAHLAAARKDWGLSTIAAKRINVTSGGVVLRHARRASRFVFVSTLGVHGCTNGEIIRETSPLVPYDSYGASKVEAERSVEEAARSAGIAATIVRPGIIYGPGDSYGMVTNMARLIAARRFLYIGGGANRMQLLHVTDLAQALCSALLRPQAAGQTLILAGAEVLTLRELAQAIGSRLGAWVPPLGVPETLARAVATMSERFARLRHSKREPFLTHSKLNLMTRHYVSDTARATAVLDFQPAISLERGLDETLSWLRAGGMRPHV